MMLLRLHWFVLWPAAAVSIFAYGLFQRGQYDYIMMHAKEQAKFEMLMSLPIEVLPKIETRDL